MQPRCWSGNGAKLADRRSVRGTATPTLSEDDHVHSRPLHPDINSEFKRSKLVLRPKSTVFDACMHIIKQSGWGTMQEIAMKTATVEDLSQRSTAYRSMTSDLSCAG